MIPREGPLDEAREQLSEISELGEQVVMPVDNAPETTGTDAIEGTGTETSLARLPEIEEPSNQSQQDSSGKHSAGSQTRKTGEDAPKKRLGAHASSDTDEESSENAPAKKSEGEIKLGGHTVNYGMIFKFVGLLVFFGLMALIMYLIWPTISGIFEEGGAERLVEDIRNAGPLGVLMLLGLQFLQIVVAFIPGEVVQVAAGMMYGPWLGALVIIVGCVISSAFIYWLVHKLGAPFVQAMVPERFLDRINDFESSGKLNVVVFILFLIPGLPKDTFTYIVPLTRMRMGTFLILSNIARIPGVLLSTYAANGIMEGDILTSVLLFLVAAVLACIGLFAGRKYMDYKMEKEDPEAWQEVKAQREAKKAKRQAKRAKAKAKRAKKKATKQAHAYEEYKQAQARIKQYEAARARAYAQGQAQQGSSEQPQGQAQSQPRER
ncbi:MAG: TVP38/TMEM64 family protein [Eggerthellaceae bacterium]|nr:TVP38/TMEM64 family protein [Eggerthellaceae bacterium]